MRASAGRRAAPAARRMSLRRGSVIGDLAGARGWPAREARHAPRSTPRLFYTISGARSAPLPVVSYPALSAAHCNRPFNADARNRSVTMSGAMVHGGLTAPGRFPEWVKAALQPAMLLYLLLIPALWAAVSFILMFERQRTLDVAIHQGSNLVRLFEENTTSM